MVGIKRLNIHHSQSRAIKKRMSLVYISLPRPRHRQNVQIHPCRPPVDTRVRQHHVIDQNQGVRTHGRNKILEHLQRLFVVPIVGHSPQVVILCSCRSSVSVLVQGRGIHNFHGLGCEEVMGHELETFDGTRLLDFLRHFL